MESTLSKVYNELFYLKKVKSQTDFGNRLGYNKGYVSTLLKSTQPPNAELAKRLHSTFGVSREWLENGDSSGFDMFGKPLNDSDKEAQLNNESDNPMLMNLIKATMDQSAAAKDSAAAMLIIAKSNMMLTEIIQQRFGDSYLKKAVAV